MFRMNDFGMRDAPVCRSKFKRRDYRWRTFGQDSPYCILVGLPSARIFRIMVPQEARSRTGGVDRRDAEWLGVDFRKTLLISRH